MVRLVFSMILVCMFVGIASVAPAKDHQFTGDGLWDTREGGESWDSAVPIPNPLPYSDTGATCDNHWDVDFSCGYTGGSSPDVFYSYTACVNGLIDVSLCGSGYDTELAIFGSGHNELYCNDDSCGLQSHIANISVTAGQLYYIVVSGFAGSCGSYVINVTGPGCPVPTQDATWGHIKSMYH